MAYNVSQEFREQCYSGESLYSCRLIIGGDTIPIEQIASITISSPIVDSNNETFYIGTFISQKLTIEFKNLDGIDTTSGTNVELYISQNVNGTDIEVPIGKYLIDESPENYYKSSKIDCLDYAIKFATNVDYSPSFVGGKTTIDNLLQWLCTYYGVTLGSYPDTNGNVEIGTYDSTVSGKRWISYIAEIKGCNAKMDRLGQLTLVPIKSSPVVTIDALKSKSWELGEKFEISQVTFFDAIRNYTYGDDSENTLFIRQDNPFVINEKVVENIYEKVRLNAEIVEQDKSFSIENTIEGEPIENFKFYGQTQQDSTTGKNKLYFNEAKSVNGVTFTPLSNGKLKINGKSTDVIYLNIGKVYLEANTDYTFSISYGESGFGPYLNASVSSGGNWVNTTTRKTTFQVASANTYNVAYYIANDKNVNQEIELQIEKGSSVSSWEPYTNGASPNPDYPQEIHNVSGDNTIYVCGKNFMPNLQPYLPTISGTQITFNNDNSFNFSGTPTGSWGAKNTDRNIFNLTEGNYTLYLKGTGTFGGNFYLTFAVYYEDGSSTAFRRMITSSNPEAIQTFSIGALKIIRTRVIIEGLSTNQSYDLILFPMIVKGTYTLETIGNYEAYKGQSQLISLGVENLFDGIFRQGTHVSTSTANCLCSNNAMKSVSGKEYTFYTNLPNTFKYKIMNCTANGTSTTVVNDTSYSTSGSVTVKCTVDGYLKILVKMNDNSNLTPSTITGYTFQVGIGTNRVSNTPIELNKIGNYKDYIYPSNDKWYLHKEIGKVVLDGSENWNKSGSYLGSYYLVGGSGYIANAIAFSQLYCNYFTRANITSSSQISTNYIQGTCFIETNNGGFDLWYDDGTATKEQFKTWLSTHNTSIYYPLDTPTDTEITDTTLLAQLDNLENNSIFYDGVTNVSATYPISFKKLTDEPFICYSLTTENYGDISLDAWDTIHYTLGDEDYYTLNNNTITYAMTIMSKIETKIPTKQQEVTTNVVGGNEQQQIRRIKTEINTIDNTITLQAQEIATNTSNIATNTSNISTNTSNISTLNTNLNGLSASFTDFYDNEYIVEVANLQDQIDGAIQFWNGPAIPTLNNYPANQWTTEADRNNHRADIYTVIEDVEGELKQGKSYRFDKVGSTWQWVELTDNELSAVQALAQQALDKSNANEQGIADLNDELSNPTNQLSGTSFDIEDALDKPLQDFKMYGDTQQDSTTGKNLLNNTYRYTDQTINGITVKNNGDGSVTMKGTATANFNISFTYSFQDAQLYGVKLPAGTYTQQCGARLGLYKTNGSWGTNTYGTFTIEEDMYIISMWVEFRSGNTYDRTQWYQVETGSTATPYEPYTNGAAPNPEFPMDIHNVSGDNTIEIVGKNLLNIQTIVKGRIDNGNIGYAGAITDLTLNDNSFSFTTNNNYRGVASDFIKAQPLTYYILSYNSDIALYKFFDCYDKDKVWLGRVNTSQEVDNWNKFYTLENTSYVRVSWQKQTTGTTTITNPQLEKSSTATSYEAYTGQSQLISLGYTNMLDIRTLINDKGLNTSNGKDLYDATGYSVSQYIKIRQNVDYSITNNSNNTATRVYYYDENKNFLSTERPVTSINSATATYIRLQDNTSHFEDGYVIKETGVTPIELCKIGNYKDYIYKTDKWYWHKEIGKVIFKGGQDEGWFRATRSDNTTHFYQMTLSSINLGNTTLANELSNNFKLANPYTDNGNSFWLYKSGTNEIARIGFSDEVIDTADKFKTWLSTHNTEVYYVLATPTDIEITDPTLLEQLNNIMTIPLIKDLTHIIIKPSDLTPTLSIEYLRNTSINENFVRQPQLNNYYTRVETDAQINISSNEIQQSVIQLETLVDSNGDAISSVSNQVQNLQTSTSTQINTINQKIENGVETLVNNLVTIDINGINVSTNTSKISTIMTNSTFAIKDTSNTYLAYFGYDEVEGRSKAEMDNLTITNYLTAGAHREEKYEDENTHEIRTGYFYIGGGN